MNGQRTFIYTNADGTDELLVAEVARDGCTGCVGKGQAGYGGCSPVCERLPNCAGIIWMEAV